MDKRIRGSRVVVACWWRWLVGRAGRVRKQPSSSGDASTLLKQTFAGSHKM